MINRWIDIEFPEQPDTSDAQYLLLHDTGFGIASVKMARDHAVDRGVLIDVRVEQVERDPPDSCEPCLGVDFASTYMDHHRGSLPTYINYRFDSEAAVEYVRVMFFLPTVVRDVLPEISVPVKKADSDERNVQVARRL